MSMSQSYEQCWWRPYLWKSSNKRWSDDSGWESSSWGWSGHRLQPAKLPVEKGDTRFAKKHRSRVYICDACGSRNEYVRRSMPFDGQYVDTQAIRGRTPANLERAYRSGEVNATWFCTRCHQRDNEHIEDTRWRIGAYDTKRIQRTTEMLRNGFRWCR